MKFYCISLAACIASLMAVTTMVDPANAYSVGPFVKRSLFRQASPSIITRIPSPHSLMNTPTIASPGRWINRLVDENSLVKARIVTNDEKTFQIDMNVPTGIKAEDIRVSVEEGILTVTGEVTKSMTNSKYSSKFSRSFSLDSAVQPDQLNAVLKENVLTLVAAKQTKVGEQNKPDENFEQRAPSTTAADSKKHSKGTGLHQAPKQSNNQNPSSTYLDSLSA